MNKESGNRSIEVVAAVIRDGGKIFATQRGYGDFKGFWEFPGGKIEKGETAEEALKREIMEELDSEIKIESLFTTVEYDYPGFHLKLHCFICSLTSGVLTLKEHESSCWLDHDSLESVMWLPADHEVIRKLQDRLRGA